MSWKPTSTTPPRPTDLPDLLRLPRTRPESLRSWQWSASARYTSRPESPGSNPEATHESWVREHAPREHGEVVSQPGHD